MLAVIIRCTYARCKYSCRHRCTAQVEVEPVVPEEIASKVTLLKSYRGQEAEVFGKILKANPAAGPPCHGPLASAIALEDTLEDAQVVMVAEHA